MARRWGDRRDGTLIRDLDSMHYIMPLMYPNRCDNEACMRITINLAKTEEYIKQVNQKIDGTKINLFQVIITAALKTIRLRPQMNRFIANKNLYQRNNLTAAFTVKKTFEDDGEETLARIVAEDSDTLKTLCSKVNAQIELCKTSVDKSTESMNFIQKLPFKHFIGAMARVADRHGWMPESVIASDPYQCSIVLTNLGSIGLNTGYHHMTNWGTTSVFMIIGKKKRRPVYDMDGNVTMKKQIDLSMTIDERIADGYYYARTLKLLKKLIENPELLEKPISTEVSF
ncbi:MAG: 2-oxo acid dehydrogenase subunit E2 [Eubacterium sp.]|nr:2-oxo acid dehydrogenase subunit E2 [Eubacterium sp.]